MDRDGFPAEETDPSLTGHWEVVLDHQARGGKHTEAGHRGQ